MWFMGDGFRLTAVECWIKDVLEGFFSSSEEGPSKVVLKNNLEVGRVNILGTITTLLKGIPFRFVVDDGTSMIEVIDFEKERDVAVGDFVRIVGIPKEYLGTRYIILEIIKKTDPLWMKIKKKKIPSEKRDVKEEVLEFIRSNDSGTGVSFEDIESALDLGDALDNIIAFLLEKGYLFEIKPGFLKVLE